MRVIEIALSKGGVALVDEADHEKVRAYRWWRDRKGYATTKVTIVPMKSHSLLMHRLIMDAPPGIYVDHIDHDPLNNTRANLRLATNSQNQANKRKVLAASGYKGVWFNKQSGRWSATVMCKKKRYYLGLHDTPEQESAAYAKEAERLFGVFAYNPPPEPRPRGEGTQ